MKKASTILALSLALLGTTLFCSAGQHAYHGYLMKGTVVSASGGEVYLCVGTKDGAKPGQELKAYRIEQIASGGGKATGFRKIDSGMVKILEVVDEHFAKASVTSGKVETGYVVELE